MGAISTTRRLSVVAARTIIMLPNRVQPLLRARHRTHHLRRCSTRRHRLHPPHNHHHTSTSRLKDSTHQRSSSSRVCTADCDFAMLYCSCCKVFCCNCSQLVTCIHYMTVVMTDASILLSVVLSCCHECFLYTNSEWACYYVPNFVSESFI